MGALSFEFSQAKLHRLVARPGWSASSSVTCMPDEASLAATDAPSTPAPITTQRRDPTKAIAPTVEGSHETGKIAEPLITFYHAVMRPIWSDLEHTRDAEPPVALIGPGELHAESSNMRLDAG